MGEKPIEVTADRKDEWVKIAHRHIDSLVYWWLLLAVVGISLIAAAMFVSIEVGLNTDGYHYVGVVTLQQDQYYTIDNQVNNRIISTASDGSMTIYVDFESQTWYPSLNPISYPTKVPNGTAIVTAIVLASCGLVMILIGEGGVIVGLEAERAAVPKM